MTASTLDATFAAPTRRAILSHLVGGKMTVKELSAPFRISGPAISRHLRVLDRAGLITRGREAQWRPCRLDAAPLAELADWTEAYRRFGDANYDRRDDHLRGLKEREQR